MKTKKNFILFLAMFFLAAISLTSCTKDDEVIEDPTGKDIVEVASSNSDFSILVSAIQKAELVTALKGEGPYTVFAPSNEAFTELFNALGVEGIDDLSAETLRPILLNHVVEGEVKSADIETGYSPTLNTQAPDNKNVKIFIQKDGSVKVDESTVTIADIEASNGVIHAVDKVILPAGIVNHAINNPDFSILVEAVVKAGLVEALSADGPFTVFAPTNEAFNELFSALGVSGIGDLTAEQLTPILLYHVVQGNVTSDEVATGEVSTLNDSSKIDIMVSSSGVVLNSSANVVAVDVQGKNGVIHVIDEVLIPGDDNEPNEKDIVEVASSNSDFSILVSALQKADLVTALKGEGPFTVFAPTNEAFTELFNALGVGSLDDLSAETLKPILLNHVVQGEVKSADVETGYLETLNNQAPDNKNVKIFLQKSDGVKVDESTVTIADIEASNGVIHAIDKVILPASVVKHAINNPNFSILVEAVVKAGLLEALSAEGPFTIFAPTNDAFNELFAVLGVSGISDLSAEQLTPILLYHVVSGNVTSDMVTTGQVATLNETCKIDVMVSSTGVTLNTSSNVILTDVQGTNGVIHVIDEVLIPKK